MLRSDHILNFFVYRYENDKVKRLVKPTPSALHVSQFVTKSTEFVVYQADDNTNSKIKRHYYVVSKTVHRNNIFGCM